MPLPHTTENARVDPRVAAALAGDLAAFESLYRDHVGRVHALAVRMCASRAFAEEMTQEVFVKAWRRLDRFDGRSKFGTWLHRLAVNAILDGMRHEAHEPEPTDSIAHLPDNVRVFRQGRLDLERAIATLPTKARAVFVLHDVEGYKHTEIAEMMGISPGTARGQLHRARALLREVLA